MGVLVSVSGAGPEMRIGVVGCGKVGKAPGTWASKAGYAVVFTSRTHKSASLA